MKKYLLFDLDGTLTDPKVGITTSVQYALHAFGIEEPDIDKLEPFIGPPLRDSFMKFYGMSAEQAEEAVEKYRERFQDIGIFENEVYAGIPHMLRNLQAHGMTLAVASSKPQVFVERILEHFHLQKYFTVVVGSELNGKRENKDEVVAEALRQLFGGKEIQRELVYMVGDRKFDVEGAKALQVESVGVTYGYGSMEELKESRADYIVQSVPELERFLLRSAYEEEEAGRKTVFQKLLDVAWAILLFECVRTAVSFLFALIGLQGVLPSAVGFVAAGIIIWKSARKGIVRTAHDTRLTHLKKNSFQDYLFLAFASVGMVLGLNFLFEMIRFTSVSEAYLEVEAKQYAVSLPVGLLVFGLISPVAEELLFRGIVHNSLRRVVAPGIAVILSSAVFGIYHMNLVQGLYGFLISCLIAYAYEYFGDFRVAAAVHMGANLLAYCLTYAGLSVGGAAGWAACAIFLAVAAASLWMMSRQRKVF